MTSNGTDWTSAAPAAPAVAEWTYVSKLTFTNSDALQSFTGLSVHDEWRLVINVHTNSNAQGNISIGLNGITASNYNTCFTYGSGIGYYSGFSRWVAWYGNDATASYRFNGACYITGKHFDGKKSISGNFSSTSFGASVLLSGNHTGDSNDVTAINIIPDRNGSGAVAITGTVELYYKDYK